MTISLSVPLNWKFVSPLILISLAALFTVTTNPLSMTVFQSANTITLNVATTAFINVTPNPIQIGQMVHIDMWVEPLPPTPADVFFTLIVTVAKPDGTTEFLGPFLSYPNGSAHTSYMPTQIGTYMLHLNYSGQYFANNTIYYLPSVSPVTTLNVMQELVQVTLIVDDDGLADFSSIQEAVDAASTGDVIYVRNGHYNEHVVVSKSLSLFGENASQTVIDGNNEIMENVRNVVTINAYNVVVSGFTIQRSAGFPYEGAGVYLSGLSAFANVSGNKVTSNYYGFYLNSSSYNNISLNEVIDNYCGFCLRSSSNNVFSANNITNNDQDDYQVGFSVTEFSSNNVISGNNIANNDAGVGVSNSDGTTISANNITNGENGITLHFGSRSIVHANNIIDTRNYGIQLDFSHNCNVSQNTVTSNSWYAVFIYYSSENTIFANDITDNSNCGFRLDSSSNNTLYHNNIVNNTIQVSSVDSVNTWDAGYPSGGNYWSDYNGTDNNGDGIGDSPYVIDVNNTDRYPLMTPYVSSVYPPQPSPSPSPSPSPTTTPTPSPSPSPSSTPVIPETNPVATLVALVVVTCIVAAAIRKKAFRHISNKASTFCLTSRMSGRLCHKR